jgi:aspartyl-tRNA(Asn)/glutamyl-tRNA(Gln) amidotransferase subunit A
MTIDTLRLTAEEAMGLVERGEASGAELHRAYLDAIAERDPELHAFLCTVDEPEGDGVPIALKDLISTRGVATTAASKILEGYKPVYDATVAARCKAAGLPLLGKTNLDEFAMAVDRELRLARPEPVGPEPRPGYCRRRSTAAVAAGAAPWALGSDTGGSISSRRRFAASSASARRTAPSRATGSSPSPPASTRSARSPRPSRDCRAAAPDRRRPRPARLDHRRAAEPGRAARRPRTSRACASARAQGGLNEAEGIEPGVSEAVNQADELARELGAEVGSAARPARSSSGALLLPDRSLGGPPPTSPATTASLRAAVGNGDVRAMYERTRDAGFGTSRSAGSCSAPTPSRLATTTPTTARRRRCGP